MNFIPVDPDSGKNFHNLPREKASNSKTMFEPIAPEFRVATNCLRIGVFIRLDGVKWYDHPFLSRSFKITNDSQLQTLRDLGISEVVCIPGKSDVPPLDEPPRTALREGKSGLGRVGDEVRGIKEPLLRHKEEQQERIARREKRYEAAREQFNTIVKGITGGNQQSVKAATDFAEHFSASFLEDAESALHLIGEGVYYHSMNVTVLAMMLGRELGISAEDMKILCQGALLHDIGKSRIDKKVLSKEKGLTKPELDFLMLHPKYGVEILALMETVPKTVLMIVYQHHEAIDGSGYPKGLMGEQIYLLSQLVTIADVYDSHCNKRTAVDCLTPYEALSHMFSRQKSAFDETLLATFIRYMGIYPPGTIVRLNDESIGIVISMNPADRLKPNVMLYDPEIPKKDAPIINLEEEAELKITASLRPSALPPHVYDYLSPRSQITYFFDTREKTRHP